MELVTRIAVQPLEVDQGLVREAMNSLYSLFATSREVLKAAGNLSKNRHAIEIFGRMSVNVSQTGLDAIAIIQ
ncbi:MAG: hypothetical protein RMY29_020865 [Nostoc sp. CreGUA01]